MSDKICGAKTRSDKYAKSLVDLAELTLLGYLQKQLET